MQKLNHTIVIGISIIMISDNDIFNNKQNSKHQTTKNKKAKNKKNKTNKAIKGTITILYYIIPFIVFYIV